MFLLLLGIGFVAGVITAVTPCVLPVLPILLAGGASGRKPLRIIAGLVASFSVFTLFATWLLSELGLPQDFLRNLAIAFLFVLAGTLLVPQFAFLLERPLAAFSRIQPKKAGGGFFFGATLGLVFVPCAGPVLAAVSADAAQERYGIRVIFLTVAYALGAAVPMLAIAYGGRETSARLREHARTVRLGSGLLIGLVALGLVFHLDDNLAKFTPGYTSFLQKKVESNKTAQRELTKVSGSKTPLSVISAAKSSITSTPNLPDYGVAPPIHADGAWINSPPLNLAKLHGKVVLIDFWTYSCINCLRTLPHLKAWYATYHKDGLVIIGVHTPEFAFEHVTSNVEAAVKRLGIKYPVVQDNDYKTWDNYANQYWPAEYLIDKNGHVRHTDFGEGQYPETEKLIRTLLGAKGPNAKQFPDLTPTESMTPETYLGLDRIANYVGSALKANTEATYTYPVTPLAENLLAYGGRWDVGAQHIVAGPGASLRLHFHAKDVYIVLGGKGTVQISINGKPTGKLDVNSYRLYNVYSSNTTDDALLQLSFTPGVQAYSFTFG
jgi:cytochrome c biogenesis protein CcdA/thiol-disulfide isomerase/thioredoxin